MNTTSNLRKLALAFLFAATVGVSSSPRAQTAPKSKPAPTVVGSVVQPPLAVKPVADKLAPAGWTRYEIGEPSRFSLILPAAPTEAMNKLDVSAGVNLTVRNYMVGTETGVYGATYIVGFPAAANNWTEANKRTFFEGFAKGFVKGFQDGMSKQGATEELKVVAQRTATASGLAGHEQDFAFGAILGRVRMVFAGQSAYALAAFWNEQTSESDRKAFFDSLRVNNTRR
ncbi:MAG TPA: hypothetical protein VK363_09410 [Pyrinomonadaceae bacterium]|nr:hypothetical protein [Pyrinomonadaceae bacterium]